MHEALILCRFMHVGAVLLLFGVGLFRHLTFADALRRFNLSAASPRLDRAMHGLTALALCSALAWLMMTAASMADAWSGAIEPQTLALVLLHTFFGHVWLFHVLLSGIAVVVFSRWTRSAPRALWLLNILLLLTLAPVGHGAMFDGVRGALLIFNQMLHLLGVGAWLGGLLMLMIALGAADRVDMRAVLTRFSGIGYGLVALIIVTGMFNVRALSGAFWPEPAFGGFGGVLALKVLMVVCMLLLAALNRHMARAETLNISRLRLSVALEGMFGAAALAAVSLLGTLPPVLG